MIIRHTRFIQQNLKLSYGRLAVGTKQHKIRPYVYKIYSHALNSKIIYVLSHMERSCFKCILCMKHTQKWQKEIALSISRTIWMNRWVRNIWFSDTDIGIQNNLKQNLSYCHFVHYKSHVKYLGSKTSVPGEKPVTNQLSSGPYHSL